MTPDARHLRLLPFGPIRTTPARFEASPRIDDAGAAHEQIPASVWDEMGRAAELWQSLHDDGKQLRYELDEETGSVSAELRDLEGRFLRPVALSHALGACRDDSSAA